MSEAKTKVDLTEDRIFPVAWGIVHCVVCAPKAWAPDRVAQEATRRDPPGTSLNEWVVSEPRERKDKWDGINHKPCPDSSDRLHWLLNC